jgi:hypothetical protein
MKTVEILMKTGERPTLPSQTPMGPKQFSFQKMGWVLEIASTLSKVKKPPVRIENIPAGEPMAPIKSFSDFYQISAMPSYSSEISLAFLTLSLSGVLIV